MHFLRALVLSCTCLCLALAMPHWRLPGGRAALSAREAQTLMFRAASAGASATSGAASTTLDLGPSGVAEATGTAPATTSTSASAESAATPSSLAASTSFGPDGEFINGFLQVGPDNDVEGQDEEANSQNKVCTDANDCIDFCTAQLPNVSSTLSGCDFGGLDNGAGICFCGNGTVLADLIVEALEGIAEVACQVFNKALDLGIDIATAVVPASIAATAAEKAAVTGVKKALKEGGKSGVIDFCAGVNFTVVPSTLLNNIPRATIMPVLNT